MKGLESKSANNKKDSIELELGAQHKKLSRLEFGWR